MPYFVVLRGRDWWVLRSEERRAMQCADPYDSLEGASRFADEVRERVRAGLDRLSVSSDFLQREVGCYLVDAPSAQHAEQRCVDGAAIWTLSNRPGEDGEGAGDRAPRPRPNGGPSISAAATIPRAS